MHKDYILPIVFKVYKKLQVTDINPNAVNKGWSQIHPKVTNTNTHNEAGSTNNLSVNTNNSAGNKNLTAVLKDRVIYKATIKLSQNTDALIYNGNQNCNLVNINNCDLIDNDNGGLINNDNSPADNNSRYKIMATT